MNTIEIKNLKKAYGEVKAVDDLSFQIKKGQIFGLLGPNGAGKTTTLEIIEGIRDADDGQVFVMGYHSKKERKKVKSLIGIQLQSSSIDPLVTPFEAVKLYALFYRKKNFDAEAQLKRFGLLEKKNALVKQLSGGQKQRLMLALATIHDPELLILDEPTASLDPQSRQYIWQLLRDLRDQGKTTLISTHFVLEAEELCDLVAIIDFGKMIQLGSPQELIQRANLSKSIIFEYKKPIELADLKKVTNSEEITRSDDGEFRVVTDNITKTMGLLMQFFSERDEVVENLHVHEPSLEDVFIHFTGRSLRA